MEDWTSGFFDEMWLKYGFPLREDSTDKDLEQVRWAIGERPLRILDLACGLGRLAIPLAESGYAVTAMDFQPIYIAEAEKAAKSAGVKVDFVVGDMRDLDYTEEFDAVINFWTSFGYFADEVNRDIVRRICKALKPGGKLVLQTLHRDWLIKNLLYRHWFPSGDGLVLNESDFDLTNSTTKGIWVYLKPDGGKNSYEMHIRLYSCHEMIEVFTTAGFSETTCWSDIDEPITIDSNRLMVIGIK